MKYKLEFPVSIMEFSFSFDISQYYKRWHNKVEYYKENKEELYETIKSNFNWWCGLNNISLPDPRASETLWKIMWERYEEAKEFFYKAIENKDFYPISYVETDEDDYILFGIKETF